MHQGVCLQSGREVKTQVKLKCVKAECPVCKATGAIQLFLNRNLGIKYARTRHYSHLDKVTRKPQFTYCKLEDLEALKTLLLKQGDSLNIDESQSGQLGQGSNRIIRDHKLKDSSVKCHNGWAGSSVRIEHHPPKVGVVGSNPTSPVLDEPRALHMIRH